MKAVVSMLNRAPRHEDVWRKSGLIAPHILKLVSDGCGQLHAPDTLQPGKQHRYPFDRRQGGNQRPSGRSGIEIKSPPLPGIQPRSSSP